MKWNSAPAIAAIVLVVAFYVFIGSVGGPRFRWVEWWESGYPNLAEGFFKGQLSLAQEADPRLAALPDPYDPNARNDIQSVHDASYYKGRFYLYFSPLPVLLVYIPVKLIAGHYPSDPIVGTFFAVCAFLAQAAFVIRAVRTRGALWILFAGLAGVTTFILLDIWMYEVAILCGMAFASLWAYALLRFHETPTRRWAALMGTFLALAIASRPTLIVLGAITLVAVWKKWREAVAVAIPLLLVGTMYGAYNYARFGSPLETGQQYQLTNVSLRTFRSCSLCSGPELARFLNSVNQYLFREPAFGSKFPFAALNYNEFDPAVSFPAKHEEIGGILAIVPLAIIGSLAALFALESRAAKLLIAGGWLMLLALSTCAWVTARYELDFQPELLLGTILAIEAAPELRRRSLRVLTVLLASYSIVFGILLGFTGRTQAFQRFNPELFNRIASWF
jgi:hypothetical protein